MTEPSSHVPKQGKIFTNASNHLINPIAKLIKTQHQRVQDFQAGHLRTNGLRAGRRAVNG